ncbi:MAG: GntR family transcriptional regulator, partial [Rhodospirillales bacterium]|nr:GntR family transcriptional regulator [Rhodospirillales bacterium]
MAQKAAVSAANSNKATKTKKSQTLYQKVDNIIRQRLIDNVWKPGDALPSEMQLADELDVSQGTVRKALNDMVTENLLFRRQGL